MSTISVQTKHSVENTAATEVMQTKGSRKAGTIMLIIGVFFTLLTYQVEHNGLWGKLVNYNKLPLITMQGTSIQGDVLHLSLYRPNGPDTYGSFVEKVTITDPKSKSIIETWLPAALSKVPKAAIKNVYHYQKVKAGPWGLVVPLAAKAAVTLRLNTKAQAILATQHSAKITVEDVSGVKWSFESNVSQ